MKKSYRPTLERLESRNMMALIIAMNSDYPSQTIAPNMAGVKIGSFTLHNDSITQPERVIKLLVGLSGTEDIWNLSGIRTSVTSRKGTIPIQPRELNPFLVNEILPPGASQTVDIFANSANQTGVTAITSLSAIYADMLDGAAFATPATAGQMITFDTGHLNTPTLIQSASTISQYITSANGVTDGSQATYNVVATGGAATIQELRFAVVADSPAAITAVRVGNITAQVVNGIADLTGLNLAIPNGGSGFSLVAYVSYAPVGASGIPSGTTAAIGLSYVRYVSGGTTQTLDPATPIMSHTMTLVGSAPSIVVGTVLSPLTVGTIPVASLTISASTQGDIRVEQLPLVFRADAPGTHIAPGTALNLLDQNGVIVANATVGAITGDNTWSASAIVTFTNGYIFPAGTSQHFVIEVAITSLSPGDDLLGTIVGPRDLFLWTDLVGNGITGAESGALMYSFPTNTAIITN